MTDENPRRSPPVTPEQWRLIRPLFEDRQDNEESQAREAREGGE
ncbi:MAG TPA: hypothetical protein VFA16_15850 [Mycobacterium sp.]|nr:hypothetical protein [Mycobacterium sp.]HZU48702.1 hypothetical protein [Mycobacterium sp.]